MVNFENIPHDVDIEKEVIGAMLIRDGEKIPAVLGILSEDDFYLVEHKILFRHIAELYLKGIKPDMLSLIEALKKTGEFETVGIEKLGKLPLWTYTNAYIYSTRKLSRKNPICAA